MGYQESFLVCYSKEAFDKLCKALNTAKPQTKDYVEVYAIGKLKKTIDLLDPLSFIPERNGHISKGCYFVWWGGERHPFQSGWKMTKKEMKIFNPRASSWNCIFCEYIADIEDLLFRIDTQKKGVLQENDITYLFELPDNDVIREEYIKMIDENISRNEL